MKICDKCSVANDDAAVFCTGCGAVLPNNAQDNGVNGAGAENFAQPQAYEQPQASYSQPQTSYAQPQNVPPVAPPPYSQPYYSNNYGYTPINENMLPEEYKPVTMWQYVGYTILFGLPIIGIIMLLITAFGSNKNINLKNFARSYLVLYAIGIVIGIIVSIAGALTAFTLFDSGYYYY